MNILRRLFKIGQAEAHSAVDNLEDPIKLTQQGLRDMKDELDKGLQSLAQIKALAIRSKNDVESFKNKAQEYENKAIELLRAAQHGSISTEEADRLASEALIKKEENSQQATRSFEEQKKYDASVTQMENNIKNLRRDISKWENELKTLTARMKVSDATKNINKQLAQLDSSGTVSMLERMKDKVAQEEALSASYAEIANEGKSIDDEIDRAIGKTASYKTADELASLKAKLGLKENGGQ